LASILCGNELPDNSHNDARHEAADDEKNGFGPTSCPGGFFCGQRSTLTLREVQKHISFLADLVEPT
jgi:hypothetical protein